LAPNPSVVLREKSSPRTLFLTLLGLAVYVGLSSTYPLLTHAEKACPDGQYPVVGHGLEARVGVCVPNGQKPPHGLRRYPAHQVPVLKNRLYRPTPQDYLKYGSPAQKERVRLAG